MVFAAECLMKRAGFGSYRVEVVDVRWSSDGSGTHEVGKWNFAQKEPAMGIAPALR
ncbi:MAG TPA: hypothetical protein VNO21_25640 [Polyangiaceae bacterium]|nr:hypothetical protein [Polyangiaceae bacterium]